MADTYSSSIAGATAGLRGRTPSYEYLNSKKPVISGITSSSTTITATRTLTEDESGSVILLDRLAGITCTLPIATNPGITYDFVATRGVTSNSFKVITDLTVSSAVIIGQLSTTLGTATSLGSGSIFINAGTALVAVTSNGSTTGGLAGSKFTLTSLSVGTWFIEGNLIGSGALVTPFASS